MGINVAIFDKSMGAGDDGHIFEFTDNDPDLLPFIRDWVNHDAFSHMEIWKPERQ